MIRLVSFLVRALFICIIVTYEYYHSIMSYNRSLLFFMTFLVFFLTLKASSFRTCMKILWAFMQVAILDGITMGCGSGISLPGMFRVVTDKTVCDLFLSSLNLLFMLLHSINCFLRAINTGN